MTRGRNLSLWVIGLAWLTVFACGDDPNSSDDDNTAALPASTIQPPPSDWGQSAVPQLTLMRLPTGDWQISVTVKPPQDAARRIVRIQLFDEKDREIGVQTMPPDSENGELPALPIVAEFVVKAGPRRILARLSDDAGQHWESVLYTE